MMNYLEASDEFLLQELDKYIEKSKNNNMSSAEANSFYSDYRKLKEELMRRGLLKI